MENATKESLCWAVAFLAIVMANACSQAGVDLGAMNDPGQTTFKTGGDSDSRADGQADETTAPAESASTENHSSHLPAEDSEETANLAQPSDVTPSAGRGDGEPTDSDQQPADSSLQGGAANAADQASGLLQGGGQSAPDSSAQDETVTTSIQGSGSQTSSASQTANGEQPADSAEQSQTEGSSDQKTVPPRIETNNPLYLPGPSLRNLELGRASYLIPGINVSESAEFIPADGSANPFQDYTVSRFLGDLKLQKIIRRFATLVDYKGGANVQRNSGGPWRAKQIEQANATENISWEKTSLVMSDYLRYYPGTPYDLSIALQDAQSDIGYGPIRHLSNVTSGFLTRSLTPRSSISFGASYSWIKYFGLNLYNSQGTLLSASYSYNLTARTGITAVYSYQDWTYTNSGKTSAHMAQFLYEHQLSPRMTLTLGGGPQFTTSQTQADIQLGKVQIPITLTEHQTGYNGLAFLGYQVPKGAISLVYEHSFISGSGLFQGSNVDFVSATMSHPVFRVWQAAFNAGFSRLSAVGSQSGLAGSSYDYGSASISLQRPIARQFGIAAIYGFNEGSTVSGCNVASGCQNIAHTAVLSLTWHARPIFLDQRSAHPQGIPLGNPGMAADNPPTTSQ